MVSCAGQAPRPLATAAASREAQAAAQRFREAISAREDLVQQQQAQLLASRQLATSYEGRIRALEGRLAAASVAAVPSSPGPSPGTPVPIPAAHDGHVTEDVESTVAALADSPTRGLVELRPGGGEYASGSGVDLGCSSGLHGSRSGRRLAADAGAGASSMPVIDFTCLGTVGADVPVKLQGAKQMP